MTTPDPTSVTREQMRAAYDALGLDPDKWGATRTITINPHGIEVLRYHRPDGHARLVPGTDAMHAELLTIRLDGFLDSFDVIVMHEGPEQLRDRASRLLAAANELDAGDAP